MTTNDHSPAPAARITWQDTPSGAIPVASRWDEAYYSRENGLAETRHVFLAGNDLPARFVPGFRLAELGFGTGLNLLAALLAWRASGTPGRLSFTSFESDPISAPDMHRALQAFPEALAAAGPLLDAWGSGRTRCETADLCAEIILGDARQTLPGWPGRADAWFLDGFSPAKNPELWADDLLLQVARHTAPNGTCATYTAAGSVRRGLQAAGFQVDRRPGHGRKRHMTAGRLTGA